MDWDYESDETNSGLILSAPVQEEHEEIESQTSNEPWLTVTARV